MPLNDQDTRVLASFASLPDEAYVKKPVVQALLGNVSPDTVERLVKQGRLPQPLKISARMNAYPVGPLRKALAHVWDRPVSAAADNSGMSE
jgi:hypothetical protein